MSMKSTTGGSARQVAANYIGTGVAMFLLLLSSFQLCLSNKIIVKSSGISALIDNGAQVTCFTSGSEWTKTYSVPQHAQEFTIQLPAASDINVSACAFSLSTRDSWLLYGYGYGRSYQACKDNCTVELKYEGSYIWNEKNKAWEFLRGVNYFYGP